MHIAQKFIIFFNLFVLQQVCKVSKAVYFNFCIFKDLSAQPNMLRRALEGKSTFRTFKFVFNLQKQCKVCADFSLSHSDAESLTLQLTTDTLEGWFLLSF